MRPTSCCVRPTSPASLRVHPLRRRATSCVPPCFEQALAITRELGNRHGEGLILNCLALSKISALLARLAAGEPLSSQDWRDDGRVITLEIAGVRRYG